MVLLGKQEPYKREKTSFLSPPRKEQAQELLPNIPIMSLLLTVSTSSQKLCNSLKRKLPFLQHFSRVFVIN